MRKLILIVTMSLLVTQVYAGGSRSLSLAATNASQATEQPATQPQANQAPTATPPASVQTATTTPASTSPAAPAQTVPAAQSAAAPVAEMTKPKHRQPSTEARVIRELHRHGIYW